MSFASLGISPSLVDAAAASGFTEPTPVQSAAIPVVLKGRDVLACAQTGSGKTAAFALPLLQSLTRQLSGSRQRNTPVLVLVPTRELASQVGEVMTLLAQRLAAPPKVVVAFGGVSINPQMMRLRGGADVVVATPGRLLDLVRHNALRLDHVQHLVLDEADRLLDLGFAEELQAVLDLLPQRRQNLFFSATFAPEVQALASSLLRNPERIHIAPEEKAKADITQRAIAVDARRRTQLLKHLIEQHQWSRVLVFVATQYAAEHIAEKLYQAGIYASPFHGGLSQGARAQVLQEFKDERWQVVVTTDLAARGIDIAQLPAVVNYDLPRSTDDYTHRIGRTGRAGETGVAVSFVTADAEAHFQLIEKRQNRKVPRETIERFEPTQQPAPVAGSAKGANAPHSGNAGNGGVKGKRPSKKDKLRAAAQAAGAVQPAAPGCAPDVPDA